MANYQNNMRCSRRSAQPAQNAQTGCQSRVSGCPDTHDHFPPICRLPWLMFLGRNGRISMSRAAVWNAEPFSRNWINRFWEKEVCADE